MSRVTDIQEEIKKLNNELKEIQEACSHPKPAVISKHDANTGNWSSADDSYWIDHHCTMCDKHWRQYV